MILFIVALEIDTECSKLVVYATHQCCFSQFSFFLFAIEYLLSNRNIQIQCHFNLNIIERNGILMAPCSLDVPQNVKGIGIEIPKTIRSLNFRLNHKQHK